MAKIYISSTFEDLKEERRAAVQAVHRLGHIPVAMENYTASSRPPLDKCLDDVRNCKAYVGIFAFKYGFIPDGYDKSITHLEYEAAKEAGIPRLIFLLDSKARWTVESISEGEERDSINKLREYLSKEYTVGSFKDANHLGSLVSPAVSRLNLSIEKTAGNPKLGSLISKMCDRNPQVGDFWSFFQDKSQKYPLRPQFYFIHGNAGECHGSLLEVLAKDRLKKHMEKVRERERVKIITYNVSWPDQGKFEKRQEQLLKNLIYEFEACCLLDDFTADVLAELPCFEKCSLVFIKHTIDDSTWDETVKRLIDWYIRDYWTDFQGEPGEDTPLFLVCFNIEYGEVVPKRFKYKFFKKYARKAEIAKQLSDITASFDDRCPCKLIEELTPVQKRDVLDWFDKHNIYEYEKPRRKKTEAIFTVNGKPVTSRSMADVELELEKIVRECQQQREAILS